MTPAELSRAVLRSVRGAVAEQELSVPVPERIVVERPPRPGCGDYASNVALRLAGPAGRPAREVAEILRKRLAGSPGIVRVEVAGPGFLNFTLGDGAQAAVVRDVLARRERYGTRTEDEAGALVAGEVAGGGGLGAREAVVADVLVRIDAAAAGSAGVQGGGRLPALVPAPSPYGLDALVARLGADEARWVLLRPAAHDHVQVPERPVQRESNPRFRVQYAYARSRAMVRNARELGFEAEPGDVAETGAVGEAVGETESGPVAGIDPVAGTGIDPVTETGPGAGAGPGADAGGVSRALCALLAAFPAVVEDAARLRAPDRVVRHLEATADAYFRWQDVCPPLPVGEEKPSAVHRARLALADAAGTVLANGLRLLGISAPEHL
ncbi:ArgS-related anticodon-binding protein NrtL [Streptomyces sp. NPDC001339]|uniref:ArgS-related anticodon-binding protein NrtL n=1 Tax=Streptomyces sp. NPDC001339 TaxID=3364563 RepID=UPI0036CC92B1